MIHVPKIALPSLAAGLLYACGSTPLTQSDGAAAAPALSPRP